MNEKPLTWQWRCPGCDRVFVLYLDFVAHLKERFEETVEQPAHYSDFYQKNMPASCYVTTHPCWRSLDLQLEKSARVLELVLEREPERLDPAHVARVARLKTRQFLDRAEAITREDTHLMQKHDLHKHLRETRPDRWQEIIEANRFDVRALAKARVLELDDLENLKTLKGAPPDDFEVFRPHGA